MLVVREILEETLVFGLLLGVGLAFVVVIGLARIHWFYRAALPVAAAWLLLPTKVYPASIFLLLTAGEILAVLTFARWWRSRSETDVASKVIPKFTLRSLFAAMALIAAVCGIYVIAEEDTDVVSQIGSSIASSATVLAAAWCSLSRKSKLLRLAVLVATLTAATTVWHFTKWFDLFEMRSVGLFLLGDPFTMEWILGDSTFGVILAICTSGMINVFYGRTATAPWRNRVAQTIAVSLVVVAAMLGGFFYYHLTWPIPLSATELPTPNGQTYFALAGESLGTVRIPEPETDIPAAIAQFVSDHGEALALVRTGLELECQTVIVWDMNYTMDDMNRIQGVRQVGRAFRAEASMYANADNYGQAAQSGVDCVRFAHEISRGGLQIHFLVALAIEGIGTAELHRFLSRLGASDCRAASMHLLRIDAAREPMSEIQERDELWCRVSYGWIGRLQFAMRELFNRPPLLGSSLHQLEQRNDAIRRLLIVELALHAYALEHGSPPQQLNELVPGYLPSLPVDPYDAAPLRYLLKDDVPVVYSIGPDGDDDSGDGANWSNLATEGDGDIVLSTLFEPVK